MTEPSFSTPAVTVFVPPSTLEALAADIVMMPGVDPGCVAQSRRGVGSESGHGEHHDVHGAGDDVPGDPWQHDAAAAARGDRVAFERLYRAHAQRVFTICLRMVSDRTKAEELTQDVFVRVWRKLPTFRGNSRVSTWLHRVAVNVVLTARKSDNAGKNRAVSDDEAIAGTPARGAFVGERLDLNAAIAGLPRGARQVFVLHDVEGFTHEEIGEQLGISAGGSKAQLHRARLLLRHALSR